MQRGEVVLGRGLDGVLPEHAGLDPRRAGHRVDRHALHRRGAQEYDVAERAERTGVVPGALRCDAQPGPAGALTTSATSPALAG